MTSKKDLGVEQLFNTMSFDRQILLAIQFIESSNVRRGFPLKESERVMTDVAPSHWRFGRHDRMAQREKSFRLKLSGANI